MHFRWCLSNSLLARHLCSTPLISHCFVPHRTYLAPRRVSGERTETDQWLSLVSQHIATKSRQMAAGSCVVIASRGAQQLLTWGTGSGGLHR